MNIAIGELAFIFQLRNHNGVQHGIAIAINTMCCRQDIT
ncbi:Uncharacterised protein [Vibrio cholerae]|nr:Uncharacterised protein [Vibrio cholerae]